MGYGHALENVGEGTAELILVFNSGDYQEVSISSVIAAQPSYLLEANLNLPENVIKKLPKKRDSLPQDITDGHSRSISATVLPKAKRLRSVG